MLYAILCYHSENVVGAWSKAEDEAVMQRLTAVTGRLKSEGRLGPVARLTPTTAATSLRKKQNEHVIVDGPFAETKEQLLGFYVVECRDLEHCLVTARELADANSPGGCYEVRPIAYFDAGSPQ